MVYDSNLEFDGYYMPQSTGEIKFRSLALPYRLVLEHDLNPTDSVVIRKLVDRNAHSERFTEQGAWVVDLVNGKKIVSFCSGSSIRISASENQNALWSILETLSDYSQVREVSFFHTHPGADFKLSSSDLKAILHVKTKQHYFLTENLNFPVHVYATAIVDGHLVTTHFTDL